MGAPTLREFVEDAWRPACYGRWKPSTRERTDSALRAQILPAFGEHRLERIRRAEVLRWFAGYSRTAPGSANRTLDIFRQILNHAQACGHLSANPAQGVRRNPRAKRTRFLSGTEIRRLYAALDAHRGRGSGRQQADIIRLLLLTGCRRGEIVRLRWSEVDEDTLRLQDTKTGPRTVFLNARARAILDRQPRSGSDYVFPKATDSSESRPAELSLWRKVRTLAGIEDVRLHDLRHTFASHAAMRAVPLPVIARLLGHADTRMTLRYAHVSDRDTEAAAERVGGAIAALLAGPAPNAPRLRQQRTRNDHGVPGGADVPRPGFLTSVPGCRHSVEKAPRRRHRTRNKLTPNYAGDTLPSVMKTVNALELRQSLGRVLDHLEHDGGPIVVCRRRTPAAALVSLKDYRERFVDREADERRREVVRRLKKLTFEPPTTGTTLDVLRDLRS